MSYTPPSGKPKNDFFDRIGERYYLDIEIKKYIKAARERIWIFTTNYDKNYDLFEDEVTETTNEIMKKIKHSNTDVVLVGNQDKTSYDNNFYPILLRLNPTNYFKTKDESISRNLYQYKELSELEDIVILDSIIINSHYNRDGNFSRAEILKNTNKDYAPIIKQCEKIIKNSKIIEI